MIPEVTEEAFRAIIGKESQNILEYVSESIDLFKDRQPIMAEIMFTDIESILDDLCTEHEIDREVVDTLEIKIKGIISMSIRAMYAQAEAKELEEMYG